VDVYEIAVVLMLTTEAGAPPSLSLDITVTTLVDKEEEEEEEEEKEEAAERGRDMPERGSSGTEGGDGLGEFLSDDICGDVPGHSCGRMLGEESLK
jgi:hypothetical protein